MREGVSLLLGILGYWDSRVLCTVRESRVPQFTSVPLVRTNDSSCSRSFPCKNITNEQRFI
jgi:hypothetical protein